MEIRKVQITGGSSFMVTLPKDWADAAGLKKNDPVRLESQQDGSLVIRPRSASNDAPSPKRIECIPDLQYLYRQLIGAYIAGHREIVIHSDGPLHSPAVALVSKFVQTAIGLEIMEEDDTHILVKDLMDYGEASPRRSIDRMRVLVRNMISDTYESAFNGDFGDLGDMDVRDTEVDRIHWLVSRQVSMFQKDPSLCRRLDIRIEAVSRMLIVSRIMERICDHAVLVSKNLARMAEEEGAESVDKRLVEMGDGIVKLFDDSMGSWIDGDMDAAEGCIERGAAMVARIKGLFAEMAFNPETATPTSLVASSSRRITEYCIDISEQTINAAMDRP